MKRFEVGGRKGVIDELPTLTSALETMRELSRSRQHEGLYTLDRSAPKGKPCLWVPALPVKCISRRV